MGGGPGAIWNNEALAEMLELTPAQREELPRAIREAMQNFQQSGAGVPQGPQAWMQRMEQSMDAVQAQINRILNPQQQVKAREAMFQLQGGLESPLLNARALGAVNITDAQKEQINAIVEARNAENQTAMEGMMRSGQDFRSMSQEERDRLRTEGEARNKKYADQISAVLTPEQRAKAEQLTAGVPALRERLGIAAPGQPQQRGQQQRGEGGRGSESVPGAGSWRPGQPMPESPGRQGGQRTGGGFPRSTN